MAEVSSWCLSASNKVSDVSEGKTVKGSYSDQSFNYGYIGDLECDETVISLKLVGFDNAIKGPTIPSIIYCSRCGKATSDYNKFCPDCGNKINK